ncbi:hypothetical protein Tco_0330912 [Tanacetum coccineum]
MAPFTDYHVPYAPQQNGVAERNIAILLKLVVTMLFHAHVFPHRIGYCALFLEMGHPYQLPPVPESRPTATRPSSSFPCHLETQPTNPTSRMMFSSHEVLPPATAPTEPSSVHQMKTRSKSGIFKTKHSPDFVSLTSHALHAALFLLFSQRDSNPQRNNLMDGC